MKPRHKKLVIIASSVTALGFAAVLVLNAFQSNLVFFFSPTQVVAKEAPIGKSFRIGGLVAEGSVQREDGSTTVHFAITDTAETIPVVYTGILPDLFREGKGVVAQGKISDQGVFRADEVLAKHFLEACHSTTLDQATKGLG